MSSLLQTTEAPRVVEPTAARQEDHRRHRVEPVVSRAGQRDAVVRYRGEYAKSRLTPRRRCSRQGWWRRKWRWQKQLAEDHGQSSCPPDQNEGLMFEKSSPGKKAYRCRRWMFLSGCREAARRFASQGSGLLPELSEIEIIRHFTRLSTWNYAIDLGMYPLGSCTMKYNPRVNEVRGADRGHGRSASLSARSRSRRAA